MANSPGSLASTADSQRSTTGLQASTTTVYTLPPFFSLHLPLVTVAPRARRSLQRAGDYSQKPANEPPRGSNPPSRSGGNMWRFPASLLRRSVVAVPLRPRLSRVRNLDVDENDKLWNLRIQMEISARRCSLFFGCTCTDKGAWLEKVTRGNRGARRQAKEKIT